jgi:outer membrane receptor for ferric coprogen and ferric-rhodotorulic acid
LKKSSGTNFHEEVIMKTDKSKSRSRGKRRAIYALLASFGIASSPAWAQAQQEETKARQEETAGEEPVTLPPVEVTGARYASDAVSVGGKAPLKPREIPQSVSVITRERIEDQNLVSMEDALNQVTGVNTTTNDTGGRNWYARGWALNVALDGVPAYSGATAVSQLDLAVYEQIEVLRGSAGLFQGSGSPGGVINLVRKRGQKERAFSASLSTGSWNNHNLQADVGGPLNESGSLRGRAVFSATDREYFHDATNTKKFLGYATLDWDLTPATTLSLAFTSQKDETDAAFTGLPGWAAAVTGVNSNREVGFSRDTNLNTDWSANEWEIQDTLAELTHRFDNGWRVTAKLNRREQDLLTHFGRTSTGLNAAGTFTYRRDGYDVEYTRDGFDLYASGPFTLFGREHQATVGYNRDRYHYDARSAPITYAYGIPAGRPDLVPDVNSPYNRENEEDYRQSGFYGQLRLRVAGPLTLIAGGRVSDFRAKSREYALPGPSSDWNSGAKESGEVTPYAGAIFDVNRQISLYASYADIFNPQTNQKYGGGTLEPRVGKQYEIGSKGEFFGGNLIASLAFFKLRDKNRAFLDSDHSGGGVYYYYAGGEIESKGWEIEVAGSPAPGWNIQAGWSRQQTTFLKDANYPQGEIVNPALPEHAFKLWSAYRFSGGALGGLTVGLGANHVSKTRSSNYTVTPLPRKQDAYTLAHAFLSYRINKNLTLSLNANNLFDETYYANLGGVSSLNIYGEPRNFALTLRASY